MCVYEYTKIKLSLASAATEFDLGLDTFFTFIHFIANFKKSATLWKLKKCLECVWKMNNSCYRIKYDTQINKYTHRLRLATKNSFYPPNCEITNRPKKVSNTNDWTKRKFSAVFSNIKKNFFFGYLLRPHRFLCLCF